LNVFKYLLEQEHSVYVLIAYAAVISAILTIWVGRTLHRNGRRFLIDAMGGNAELADSVNHLLAVGFYLVSIGYVTLALRTGETLVGIRQTIKLVSDKIGTAVLVWESCTFSTSGSFANSGAEGTPRVGMFLEAGRHA
jgi:hypothetical protein